MELKTKKLKVLIGFSVGLLVLLAIVLWFEVDLDRPWKKYQHDFVELDKKISSQELAEVKVAPESEEKTQKLALLERRLQLIEAKTPVIKQNWLTHFNVVDRCMSCHQGVEIPRFKEAPQPFTTHPGKHINPARHVSDTFGCVICHEGQGVGLDEKEAHGHNHHNWMKPLLVGVRAQSSCQACHPMKNGVAKNAVLEDAPSFSRGRSIYLNNNCLGCHLLKGFKRDEGIGPILTKVATKTNPAWTSAWIQKPKDYLPKTVMPDFELPEAEIKAITAYLFSLAKPDQSSADARANLDSIEGVQRGEKKLVDLGCLGCHTIDGTNDGFGPELSRVAEKVSPDWLYSWIMDPKKYWPETSMPNLRVPKEDAQDLVAYLSTLSGDKDAVDLGELTDKELIAKGEKLALDKGCTGCHQIGEFALGYNSPAHDGIGQKRVDELVFGDTKIEKTLADWLLLKTENPRAFNTEEMPTLMPNFGLSKDETKDLLTFLLSIRERKNIPAEFIKPLHDVNSPAVKGEVMVESNNCRGCHKIGDTGGDIGPDLSFEGQRANPQWLSKFIENPVKIRPVDIEPTRMPTFGFSKEEADSLAAYFADMNKVDYPYYRLAKKEVAKKDRDEAWKLFWQTFSCQACHAWNETGGIIGPDQSDLANRLRRQWVKEYLLDPQKFIADVQMPNFELYPDEAELLADLIMSFNEIPPAVWDQIKKRWDEELLAKQAQEMMSGGQEQETPGN